jgi:hypothetical protein
MAGRIGRVVAGRTRPTGLVRVDLGESFAWN